MTSHDYWPAPTTDSPVDATITIPGSKSLTNRYLVLAALAEAPSRLRAPLRSRDTLLMAAALSALGADVQDVPGESRFGADWQIIPAPLRGPATIEAGLAGTVMRFLPPVAALAEGVIDLDGDPHARVRPMGAVVSALRELGVAIEAAAGDRLPLRINGTGSVRGGELAMNASASSQFVSALLLAAARFDGGLLLRHVGPPIPSQPHVSMTVEALRDVGVVVDEDPEQAIWRIEPGPINGLDAVVEPDLSNAAPFLAAAALTGGEVRVPGWPQYTTQAGDAMRDVLDAMGADVSLDRAGLTVRGTGELYGVDVDLHDAGEIAPTVTGLAAMATTPSRLRGIAHIRGHETDRLAALCTEINALGGEVSETDDGLQIVPRPLHGGPFASYADHRMATTGALIGLSVKGVLVEDIGTTAKTLPQFVQLWQQMLSGDAA